MLTVVIAADEPRKLPPLLTLLTAGAVEGLVRQVVIVGAREGLVDALCEDTGADCAPDLAAAVGQARGDFILAAASAFRPKEGWIEAVQVFLAGGGRTARVRGLGGAFGPSAVLVERDRALGARDLDGLRRKLGLGARRIG